MQTRTAMRLRTLSWSGSEPVEDMEVTGRQASTEAVILLHGFGHAADVWRPMMRFWQPRTRVLAFDLPGHGRSPWLPVGEYEITTVADIISTGLIGLGLHRPILVGHSFGGRLCIELATRPSLDVRGAVLIDVGIDNRPEIISTIVDHVATLRTGRPTLNLLADCVTAQLPLADAAAVGIVVPSIAQHSECGWHVPTDPASEALLSCGRDGDLLRRLRLIRCPVAVVRGAYSSVLSREDAERIAASAPNRPIPVYDVPMAGHAIPLESPRDLARAVAACLADLRLSPAIEGDAQVRP